MCAYITLNTDESGKTQLYLFNQNDQPNEFAEDLP